MIYLYRIPYYAIILLMLIALSSCDPEDVPPTLAEIISNSDQAWKVESLNSSNSPVDASFYQGVRYSFQLDDSGHPVSYTASGIPSALTDSGLRPDYFVNNASGTWTLGSGQQIIFNQDLLSESTVEIIGTPTTERIVLEWYVPEFYNKQVPLTEIILVPAN